VNQTSVIQLPVMKPIIDYLVNNRCSKVADDMLQRSQWSSDQRP